MKLDCGKKSRTTLSYCPNTYLITYLNEEHADMDVSCFAIQLFMWCQKWCHIFILNIYLLENTINKMLGYSNEE